MTTIWEQSSKPPVSTRLPSRWLKYVGIHAAVMTVGLALGSFLVGALPCVSG